VVKGRKPAVETVYGTKSLSSERASPAQLLAYDRQH